MLHGKQGAFNIFDARSHRIPRVCRSMYSAETLAAEEPMDVGQLCRGMIAMIRLKDLTEKEADAASNAVSMTTLVDAKDVHDKGKLRHKQFGSQKSLAFTIAWIRSVLRRPNTAVKWTAAENMWVDAGTKEMDLSHLRKIMELGSWCYNLRPAICQASVQSLLC